MDCFLLHSANQTPLSAPAHRSCSFVAFILTPSKPSVSQATRRSKPGFIDGQATMFDRSRSQARARDRVSRGSIGKSISVQVVNGGCPKLFVAELCKVFPSSTASDALMQNRRRGMHGAYHQTHLCSRYVPIAKGELDNACRSLRA